jgi:hypothetical protein
MPYRDMGLDLFQTELGVPDLDAGFVEPLPGYSSALDFQPDLKLGNGDTGSDPPMLASSDRTEMTTFDDSDGQQNAASDPAHGGRGGTGVPPVNRGYGGEEQGGGEHDEGAAELEREIVRLIGIIGRLAHGPKSSPLLASDENSLLTTAEDYPLALTMGRLTPESVVGRKAVSEIAIGDLQVFTKVTILSEGALGLIQGLEKFTRVWSFAVAKVELYIIPLTTEAEINEDTAVPENILADMEVAISRDLSADSRITAEPMNGALIPQIKALAAELGVGEIDFDEDSQLDKLFYHISGQHVRRAREFIDKYWS